ncbi:MAG: energy-coupling factor ABC transporter ATP-binding protein [Anaerolineae bacterium]
MTKEVVISVRDVRYKYPTSRDWVLRGISLDVYRGEFLGIVGTTGAGKTTLCQCFNGLIPHYARGTFEGTVLVEERDTRDADVADLSTLVGLVFQDADAQLVMSSVLEEVMLGLTMRGMPTKEAKARAQETLESLGISHLASRPPYALSGGQKQRAAIAAVMAMQPDILVLDEATSELDSLTVHRIFDICRRLNEQGATIVLVSHEVELLCQFADRLALVDDGQVLLEGPPRELFQQAETFRRIGMRLPQVADFALSLADRLPFESLPLNVEEAKQIISKSVGESPIHPTK